MQISNKSGGAMTFDQDNSNIGENIRLHRIKRGTLSNCCARRYNICMGCLSNPAPFVTTKRVRKKYQPLPCIVSRQSPTRISRNSLRIPTHLFCLRVIAVISTCWKPITSSAIAPLKIICYTWLECLRENSSPLDEHSYVTV